MDTPELPHRVPVHPWTDLRPVSKQGLSDLAARALHAIPGTVQGKTRTALLDDHRRVRDEVARRGVAVPELECR